MLNGVRIATKGDLKKLIPAVSPPLTLCNGTIVMCYFRFLVIRRPVLCVVIFLLPFLCMYCLPGQHYHYLPHKQINASYFHALFTSQLDRPSWFIYTGQFYDQYLKVSRKILNGKQLSIEQYCTSNIAPSILHLPSSDYCEICNRIIICNWSKSHHFFNESYYESGLIFSAVSSLVLVAIFGQCVCI